VAPDSLSLSSDPRGWNSKVTSPTLAPPAPPTPPKPAGASSGLKLLLGCAIGCAAVGLLVFLAVGGGFWWLVSPGEQVETERVAGGESRAVVHFGGLNDDPGARALLNRAAVAMQRAVDRQRGEEMPEALRWLEELGRAQGGGAGGLGMWVPREVTLTVESGEGEEGGEGVFLVAVNLAAFPRMIRTIVRQVARAEEEGGPVRQRHRGYDIDVFPGGGALAFAGSTMMFASRPEALRRALDRLEDGPEPGPMTAVLAADGGDRWDVRGALIDHDGTLGASLAEALAGRARPSPAANPAPGELEAPEPPQGGGPDPAGAVGVVEAPPSAAGDAAIAGAPPSAAGDAGVAGAPAVERATFGVDVVTADRIEAEIRLDCASEAGALEWLARLERALRHLESEHGRGALAAGIAGTVEGARLRADIELTGVDAWLERAIAESMAEPPEDGDLE
jgi:hypothetical protein